MQGPAAIRERDSGTGDKADQTALSGKIAQSLREIALSPVQTKTFFVYSIVNP